MLKRELSKTLKILSTTKIIIITIALTSCSSQKNVKVAPTVSKATFQLKDKAGIFQLNRESGPISKAKGVYAVKRILTDDGGQILEKSVVISKLGSLKGKLPVLRPEKSEYEVWFDGKEYSTKTKIDTKEKSLIVTLQSPEEQWSGTQNLPFPKNSPLFCYFSQVIECAIATGFIHKAVDNGGGSMNFIIIWEGYPYIQQQYVGLPEEVFTRATLNFDGQSSDGLRRFSLNISNSNQIIFYQLSKSDELKGIFWPAQGLSINELGRLE